MKKLVFLFLALLLPVLIFLFLKSFGKNEFEVPVLFTDSVEVSQACSSFSYATPYTLNDSILTTLAWNKTDSFTVVILMDSVKKNTHERLIQAGRLTTAFAQQPLSVVLVQVQPVQPPVSVLVRTVQVSEYEFEVIRNCVLLLVPDQDAVVVDARHRIRGQYNLLKREDADRMIMQELNILFKRY